MTRALLTCLLLFPVLPAPAQEVGDVRPAVRRIVESGRYQVRLPGSRSEPVRPTASESRADTIPGERSGGAREVAPKESADLDTTPLSTPAYAETRGLSDFALFLLIMAGIVVVVVIVRALAMGFGGGTRRGRRVRTVETPKEEDGSVDPPLSDAEALAAQGLYAEAIRALFHDAVARLAPGLAMRSHTGRELWARLGAAGRPHEGFGRLVRAVERVLFAGSVAGQDEWVRARDDHRTWIDSLQAAAP